MYMHMYMRITDGILAIWENKKHVPNQQPVDSRDKLMKLVKKNR